VREALKTTLSLEVHRRLVEDLGVSAKAALILSRLLEKGKTTVRTVELLALMEEEGLSEEDLEEALIELEGLRALLPARSKVGRGLAWEFRVLSLRVDEEFEMPLSIYYALEGLASTGTWSYEYAAQRYFEAIKEPLADLFIDALKRLLSKCTAMMVSAEDIKEAVVEAGLPIEKVGIFISELKGGGFISPIITMTQLQRSIRGPLYELNPLLFRRSGG